MDHEGKLQPWFHGLIPREQAIEVLQRQTPGTFLVRLSEHVNGYAISFNGISRIRHYQLQLTGNVCLAGRLQDRYQSLAIIC